MANAFLKSSRLKLVFDHGMDGDKPVYKTKLFNNIRLNATPEELYTTGQAIGLLSDHPLWAIERTDNHDIDA